MSEKYTAGYFDIDKTLLPKGAKELSQTVVSAISRIPYRGVNTMRSIIQAEAVVPPHLLNLPTITLLGGEVWSPGGEIIHGFTFDRSERVVLADMLMEMENDIKVARIYPHGERRNIVYAATDEQAARLKDVYAAENVPCTVLRSVQEFAEQVIENPHSMLVIRPHQKIDVELPAALYEQFSVNDSDSRDFVISKPGVNKGSTLLWVCQELQINPLTVLTAGDEISTDTHAFQHTYGIAVHETLLPYAQWKVSDPEDLAVYLTSLFPQSK